MSYLHTILCKPLIFSFKTVVFTKKTNKLVSSKSLKSGHHLLLNTAHYYVYFYLELATFSLGLYSNCMTLLLHRMQQLLGDCHGIVLDVYTTSNPPSTLIKGDLWTSGGSTIQIIVLRLLSTCPNLEESIRAWVNLDHWPVSGQSRAQ